MSFIARRAFSTTARRMSAAPASGEAKSNSGLIIGGAVVAALGGVGYYLTQTADLESSEDKFQYLNESAKDAPSAVNVVVVPNVNLPKHLHEKYNKWGKDGY